MNEGSRPPVLLSHPMSTKTPAYGGARGVEIEALSRISDGDTANSCRVSMPNHIGTHVDAPYHFFDDGRRLTDFEPGYWIFREPVLLDVDVPSGELVGPEWVEDLSESCDLVLLRTGHEAVRDQDEYWQAGCGLSPELGEWLRANRPNVRAVGMDLISVTSRLRRAEGRTAHRAFLNSEAEGDPLLLIEDMKLAECPDALSIVLVSPIFFEALDGAPVTVWGFSNSI